MKITAPILLMAASVLSACSYDSILDGEKPSEPLIVVTLLLAVVYGAGGFAYLSTIKDSRRKKKLWNVYAALIPLFICFFGWSFRAPIFMLVLVFVGTGVIAVKCIVMFDFCDECGKLLKGRNRPSDGLFCGDCWRERKK